MNNNQYYYRRPISNAYDQLYVPKGGVKEDIAEYSITLSSTHRELDVNYNLNPFNVQYILDSKKFITDDTDDIKYLEFRTISLPKLYQITRTSLEEDDLFTLLDGILDGTENENDINNLTKNTYDNGGDDIFVVFSHGEFYKGDLQTATIEATVNGDNNITFEYTKNFLNDETTYYRYNKPTTDNTPINQQLFLDITNNTSLNKYSSFNGNVNKPDFYSMLYYFNDHKNFTYYNTDGIKINFPDSNKEYLKKFNIRITDSCNSLLNVPYLNTYRRDNICNCGESDETDPTCYCTYFRHPRHPLYQSVVHLVYGKLRRYMR